jgi:hypothetical protein
MLQPIQMRSPDGAGSMRTALLFLMRAFLMFTINGSRRQEVCNVHHRKSSIETLSIVIDLLQTYIEHIFYVKYVKICVRKMAA